MILIVIAIGAVFVMYSGRLGMDLGFSVPGFQAEDMQNWGLIVATIVGGWLAFGPDPSKKKG